MTLARKITKILKFLWYLPEKLTHFPNFTWHLPENARILHDNCPKNIFPDLFWGEGVRVPCPVSYAYGFMTEILSLTAVYNWQTDARAEYCE